MLKQEYVNNGYCKSVNGAQRNLFGLLFLGKFVAFETTKWALITSKIHQNLAVPSPTILTNALGPSGLTFKPTWRAPSINMSKGPQSFCDRATPLTRKDGHKVGEKNSDSPGFSRAINLLFHKLSQQKVNVIMTFKGHYTSTPAI